MLDLLTHLVDKSLVSIDFEHGDEPRYYLLETIRQYARERLNYTGESEQVRAIHLDYFLKLAQRAEPKQYGAEEVEWLQKLEDGYENTRSAMEWALQTDTAKGLQLIASLWRCWDTNGHLSEAYEWGEKMLVAAPKEATIARAKLLSGQGWEAGRLGNRELMKKFMEESIVLYRKLGDEFGMAFPMASLGIVSYLQKDYEQANQFFDESLGLYEQSGNKWGIHFVKSTLGYTAEAQGNFTQAQKLYEESLVASQEIGNLNGIGWVLYLMGNLAVQKIEFDRAMQLYEKALHIERKVNNRPVVAWLCSSIGALLIINGDYDRAIQLFSEAKEIHHKNGSQSEVADSIQYLGLVAYRQKDFTKAKSLFSEGLSLYYQNNSKIGVAESFLLIGIFSGKHKTFEKFVKLIAQAETITPWIKNDSNLWLVVHTEMEQYIETARAALGEEAYGATYEAGKQMTLDEAVAYALKELEQ